MRVAFVCLTLMLIALAGCLQEHPAETDDATVPEPEPVVREHAVHSAGSLGSEFCLVACVYVNHQDPDPYRAPGNESITDVRLSLEHTGDGQPPQMRFQVACREGQRACADTGVVGEEEGVPPLTVEAADLRLPPGARLVFQVEMLDPVATPTDGYTINGVVQTLEVAEEEDAEEEPQRSQG